MTAVCRAAVLAGGAAAGCAFVASVVAARSAGEAPAGPTAEQLAALREILARPEFADHEGGIDWLDFLRPLRSLLSALLLTLGRALSYLQRASGDAPVYAIILIAIAVAAFSAFVFWRLAGSTLAAEARLESPDEPGRATAEAELALAAAAAREHRWRQAIHHRYLAVLRRLDERELLRFDPSLTNVEYLRRATDRPGLADELTPLVRAFDRLWYGQAECSNADYAAFGSLAERAWRIGV